MFEKLESCPSCNSNDFRNYMVCKDHSVTQESFVMCKCSSCQLIFTNPRPTQDYIPRYYESEDYISHSNKTSSVTDVLYKIVRNYSIRRKINLIQNLTTDHTLLDYGCGTGHFLHAAQSKKWNISGVELNDYAKKEASKKLGISISSSLNNLNSSTTFGIITLWHVLEHIHELSTTITSLRERLTSTGRLIIAVPNPNSFDAKNYKEFWAGYDVPRHLYHFTQKSMLAFLKKNKLKLESVVPMLFDSFYVSLLSEKYKFGRKNLINSFITGYKSNSYAKKDGEYSSLIYIVSKA